MSLKSRLLRIVLILLLVLAFVSYFAFSTFFFSPFESDYEFDVAGLIPRDVDFFSAKADLENAFDDFPRLAVMDQLEPTDAWTSFTYSPEYANILREYQVDERLAELDTQLQQLPFGWQVQDIFGGRDVAVAGFFRGAGFANGDWAVYGRLNWVGKLGISALQYPALTGIENQGMTVTQSDAWLQLSGGTLAAPLFIKRLRDVAIISNNQVMVERAVELEQRRADSFLSSARYYDHIQNATREVAEDEVEMYVDLRKLRESSGWTKPWPDPQSEGFVPAFLGRLFQAPSCKEAIGLLGLDQGFNLQLHGEFASETITPEMNRIYRERGFDRDEILTDVARMAPEDSLMFAYLRGPIAELLRQALLSVEPALRSNMIDAFKSVGSIASLDDLIAKLDGSLKNRLAVIVRENDYPPKGDDPPNDGATVLAFTIVTWINDRDAMISIRDSIGNNGNRFGMQGRSPGEIGYFSNEVDGFQIREFWSRFIPGTGVVTCIITDEHCLISNTIPMSLQVLKTYTQGGQRYRRLTDRADFQALMGTTLENSNALVWLNPRMGLDTLRQQARQWAELNVDQSIDWRTLRAQEEAKAIPRLFPGKTKRELTQAQIAQLDAAVEPELAGYGQKYRAEQVPLLIERKERQITYLSAMSACLIALKLDPKVFDLSLQIVTPLD